MFDFERPREELNAGAPHQATPHAVRVFASLTYGRETSIITPRTHRAYRRT